MNAFAAGEGGSGGRLGGESAWPIVVAGVASGFSTLVSVGSLWTHLKQYRKPVMQRYVVRIMLMVPLYSIASWLSLLSFTAASFIDPVRDVYEAFVIYCFFNLLVNYLNGERSIIISTHGREPKAHPWPMNYVLSPCDISDPYTFLTIKRGILQYAWLKPVLALATVIMKATGTFQEGYIGITSGYLWSGIFYNISITVSLYCLAMFWMCLHEDLLPFRPVPKFLVIKLVIFASYWQGFLLSLVVWAGLIPDRPGYSSDNISLAIQDFLTCIEMPFFAIAHWYAFDVMDYTDPSIASARMPIAYAARDSFGPLDLIVDSKETLFGSKYGYRLFDPGEGVIAHAEGRGRMSRIKEGLRYERGGQGKHWVPQPERPTLRTPLLDRLQQATYDRNRSVPRMHRIESWNLEPPVEFVPDDEDERLFAKARTMEFGDFNSPSIEVRLQGDLSLVRAGKAKVSTSSHQSLLRDAPTLDETRARLEQEGYHFGSSSHAADGKSGSNGAGGSGGKDRRKSSHGKSPRPTAALQSHPSRVDEVRDLVVEDPLWEERERMRLRREGPAPGFDTHADKLERYVHLDALIDGDDDAIVDDDADNGDDAGHYSDGKDQSKANGKDKAKGKSKQGKAKSKRRVVDLEERTYADGKVSVQDRRVSHAELEQADLRKPSSHDRTARGKLPVAKSQDPAKLAAVPDSDDEEVRDDAKARSKGDDSDDDDDNDKEGKLSARERLLGHDNEHVLNPWT